MFVHYSFVHLYTCRLPSNGFRRHTKYGFSPFPSRCRLCIYFNFYIHLQRLPCGHRFHDLCLRQHILYWIDNKEFPIACPDARTDKIGCLKDLERSLLESHLANEAERKKLERRITDLLVRSNPNLRYCSSKECDYVWESTDQKVKVSWTYHCFIKA